MTPLDLMNHLPSFEGESWDPWRAVLGRLTPKVREFWNVVGRGGGKSRIAALIGVASALRAASMSTAPGERLYVAVIAPDRRQASVTARYARGLLEEAKAEGLLEVDVETRTRQGYEVTEIGDKVVLEVLTASVAAPRGRSYVCAIVEEAAFLPAETSASPDAEIMTALRPGLARVPGSLLVVISSPYARRGILWDAECKWGTTGGSESVLYHRASTLDLNPTFDRSEIERAMADDPQAAGAEYGGEFRTDVERLFSWESVTACVVPGRRELEPVRGSRYAAFVDPSGGRNDSFTCAFAHAEGGASAPRGPVYAKGCVFYPGEPNYDLMTKLQGQTPPGPSRVVVDCVREIRPPFSPEAAVAEIAALAQRYRITTVTGDAFGGEWPRAAFSARGIRYDVSKLNRSELFLSLLPKINAGSIELPDERRLVEQLVGLDRSTSKTGRDAVDHRRGAHDDVANAVAGVASVVSLGKNEIRQVAVIWG